MSTKAAMTRQKLSQNAEKWNVCKFLVECKMVQLPGKRLQQFLNKLLLELSKTQQFHFICMNKSIKGVYSKETDQICSEAIITMAERWRPLNWPSVDEWTNSITCCSSRLAGAH